MNKAVTVLAPWILLLQAVSAFQPPNHISLKAISTAERAPHVHLTSITSLHLGASPILDNALLLSDAISDPSRAAVAAASAAAGVPDPSSLLNLNVGEVVKNVALGLTAVVFLFAALTSLAAAIIIPAGAEQLELECTALIPDSWEEYKQQLEEGEEMKDRPDLMFQLGLLLNKCKADRMEQVCVEAKLAPDLWEKYQDRLQDDMELKDRPELIAELGIELNQRAAQVLKENTNVCPPATWQAYQEKAGSEDLIECQVLMEEMAQELGYPDLVGACTAALLGDSEQPTKVEGDAREDARTISGITEIRRNSNQWDEENE